MPLESAQRDLERDVELTLPAQRLAELQKDEARRVARQLVAPPPDVVSHWPPPRGVASRSVERRESLRARSTSPPLLRRETQEVLPTRPRRGIVAEPRRREREVEMHAAASADPPAWRGAVHPRRRRDARRA